MRHLTPTFAQGLEQHVGLVSIARLFPCLPQVKGVGRLGAKLWKWLQFIQERLQPLGSIIPVERLGCIGKQTKEKRKSMIGKGISQQP